jgi:phospholipid-translocating ATPase
MKLIYWPDDLDILRVIKKYNPELDIAKHPLLGGHWQSAQVSAQSDSEEQPAQHRPTVYSRPSLGSRTDMATGTQYVHRGFDFATEEDGVSMRRIQSNLSSRHVTRQKDYSPEEHNRESTRGHHNLFPSIRKTLRRHGKNRSPPLTPP